MQRSIINIRIGWVTKMRVPKASNWHEKFEGFNRNLKDRIGITSGL
jgi:hypothetical protein